MLASEVHERPARSNRRQPAVRGAVLSDACSSKANSTQLPETLHGIIAARLDGLADAEKRLLQDAAVVGKVFWLGALEAVGGVSRTDAEELLSALARREFVQRARRSSVAGDIEYAFVHELLRDVAYGEIPRADRAERHRRAAEWIDSLGRPEEHAELLAHHYLVALDYTRRGG